MLLFNGPLIERIFFEKRIYEEMIIFRPDGEKFACIKWEMKMQRLVQNGGRSYDWLTVAVTAFHESDCAELKAEHEGPEGNGTSAFDVDAHEKKHKEKMVHVTREFWFDVTSLFVGK